MFTDGPRMLVVLLLQIHRVHGYGEHNICLLDVTREKS